MYNLIFSLIVIKLWF